MLVRGAMNGDRKPPDESAATSVVAIAGSAGGIDATRTILDCLPADFPAPILYLQHVNAWYPSALTKVLQFRTRLSVRWAE